MHLPMQIVELRYSHLMSGSDLSFSSSLTVMLHRSSITVDDWEIRCKNINK